MGSIQSVGGSSSETGDSAIIASFFQVCVQMCCMKDSLIRKSLRLSYFVNVNNAFLDWLLIESGC